MFCFSRAAGLLLDLWMSAAQDVRVLGRARAPGLPAQLDVFAFAFVFEGLV